MQFLNVSWTKLEKNRPNIEKKNSGNRILEKKNKEMASAENNSASAASNLTSKDISTGNSANAALNGAVSQVFIQW